MARKSKKLTAGIGASCSVNVKRLHPSKEVAAKFPNLPANSEISNLLAIRKDMKLVNKKQQDCVIFVHPDHDDFEFHAVKKWVKVTKEGQPMHYFDVPSLAPQAPEAPQDPVEAEGDEHDHVEFNILQAARNGDDLDIAMIQGLGLGVDDDNAPAPENIPSRDNPSDETPSEWVFSGLCHSKTNTFIYDNKPHLRGMFVGQDAYFGMNVSYSAMFLFFFPLTWLKTVLLAKTNEKLDSPMTYGELLKFLGLIFFMSTISGFSKRDFWSQQEISFENAFFSQLLSSATVLSIRFMRYQPP